MFEDAYATLVSIPADALKAVGGIIGTASAAGAVYVWGRLRTPRHPSDAPSARISLSPEDRDLGFTIVRTGTDLTRALNQHGELLLRTLGGGPPSPPAPPLPPRSTRTRRPAP
ncbi:hypothetical protein [Methylobacterium sp. 37f]|uniref:hypothetical protein n=1 Tax=Methylobacterium sp. 37f TaxID=2817058 RepID=UPI001FFCB88E|nr:hypothetical protein [Methylobacterium sp. 37f]MCK2057176.1 hypothetical protein [Methylobacterium sp. 37f]